MLLLDFEAECLQMGWLTLTLHSPSRRTSRQQFSCHLLTGWLNMTQTLCVNTFYEQHRQAHITFWDNLKMTLKTYIIKFPMKNSNKILNSNNFQQKLLWKNAFCICCLSFWNYEHFREHIQGFSIVNKEENFFFQCTLNSKHHSMWETYFNTYVCWGCGYYYTHFIDRKSASKRWSKLHVCLLIKCQGHD